MAAILHLNLHRQYFVAIAAGTKTIQYRDHSPYWKRRLEGRKYDVVQFRNGLTRSRPLSRSCRPLPASKFFSPLPFTARIATKAPLMQAARIDTSPLIPLPIRGGEGSIAGKRKYAVRLGRILKLKRWKK